MMKDEEGTIPGKKKGEVEPDLFLGLITTIYCKTRMTATVQEHVLWRS